MTITDIVSTDKDAACSWCTYSLSVNVSMDAGVQFYESILEQYALEWRVDFLKNDCVFGSQYVPLEIAAQSRILESLASVHGRELAYSLSPGGHGTVDEIVSKGRDVASLVSMYRVNNDDWDNWAALNGHFDVAAAFADARLAGHPGLHGRPSFPDFDMLPLGFITSPSGNHSHSPYHMTNLTHGEARMQMALWSIAPSPLFFGGDMRRMDKFTYSLLTNADLLGLNYASTKSEQVRHDVKRGLRVWRAARGTTARQPSTVSPPPPPHYAPSASATSATATTVPARYVAVFNTGGALASEALALSDFYVGAPTGSQCQLFDAWSGKPAGEVHGAGGHVNVSVPSHDVALLRAECAPSCSGSPASRALPAAECAAWHELHANTTSGNSSSWVHPCTADDPCGCVFEVQGITSGINCTDGHIVAVNLAFNGLTGSLGPRLGAALNEVTELQFCGNALSGTLPPELFGGVSGGGGGGGGGVGLPKLTNLDVSGNTLISGTLPGLVGVPRLRTLSVYMNRLSGTLPGETFDGKHLSGLVNLELDTNMFSGKLPTSLGTLTKLYSLSLGSNHFSGSVPASLRAIDKLRVIDLRNNAFDGLVRHSLILSLFERYYFVLVLSIKYWSRFRSSPSQKSVLMFISLDT